MGIIGCEWFIAGHQLTSGIKEDHSLRLAAPLACYHRIGAKGAKSREGCDQFWVKAIARSMARCVPCQELVESNDSLSE